MHMHKTQGSYDVAVVGGGPVGCVAALAYASRGARVVVLEANAAASQRLAGEWLHPPAVRILERLGVELESPRGYPSGLGFVVYPDDGTAPMVLPYERTAERTAEQANERTFGLEAGGHEVGPALCVPHEALVEALRQACRRAPGVELLEPARVTRIVGQNVSYQRPGGAPETFFASQIVGASGRASVVHAALGLPVSPGTYSRMAGLVLEAALPFEGHGHVCLGAPGPILAYRIGPRAVRVCLDVPLSFRAAQGRDRAVALYEAYAPALPEALRAPFREALATRELSWATNQTRARVTFGRAGLALVGDAVGHHHPLTALGMTLGFQDAVALAEAPSFGAYRKKRSHESRVPELLALALYEVFAGNEDEVIEIRRSIYELWRSSEAERTRTMRFLAGDETRPAHFAASFLRALGVAGRRLVEVGLSTSRWSHVAGVTEALGRRARWLFAGALHLTDARPQKELARGAEERWAGALRAGAAKGEVLELRERGEADGDETARALRRGVLALVSLQEPDGAWEGEVVWCAMLPAQWALAWTRMGLPISSERRARVLLQLERTAGHDGLWSLSHGAAPSLFVTTLVYVAARTLGVPADAAWLAPARAFFEREGGVVAIPSWGKFWLALVGLYDWQGVNPVLPELWGLPEATPVHPSRYYCHTRLIYLAMAHLYGQRELLMRAPPVDAELTRALRAELYPAGYSSTDWAKARRALREDDLYAPPSATLRRAYEAMKALEPVTGAASRARALEALREEIRFDLRTTSHTSISPVSGLLNLLGLWLHDPLDPDLKLGVERFDGWVWEDEREGMRVAGARSATWDTSFSLQALALASAHVDVREPLAAGDAYLREQQILRVDEPFEPHHRIDPRGGFCFAAAWHGWPVSDCTAEALVARFDAERAGAGALTDDEVTAAVRFILRTRDAEGGFGSYEPKRLPFSLEWLNPAEMFGDSMTEASYAECTASCVVALARVANERPYLLQRAELAHVPAVIAAARRRLEELQLPSGAWSGSWGVHYVYGTMFGVRGLLAAGAPPTHPGVRKACAWLRAHQRPDGSWGEQHVPHEVEYVEADAGHVVQTSWALTTLLEAHDPDWDALERGARFLARAQLGSGEWPRETPAGIFFHTALLDYVLYRSYFPVLALSLYETRRLERRALASEARAPTAAVTSLGETREPRDRSG
jgi:lanosterol synthase